MIEDIDEAIDKALKAKEEGKAWSIGVHCNAVDLLQRLIDRNVNVDILTDQTSAHDPLVGYVPHSISLEAANELRKNDPAKYVELSYQSMKKHVELMHLIFQGLFLPIFVRFFAKEKVHFAGRR
jgi:urocanate hydratase